MRRQVSQVLMGLVLTVLVSFGSGCHLFLPLEPGTDSPEPCYLCSARIYRTLPGSTKQVSYEWESYVWPGSPDPHAACAWELDAYIARGLAPNFTWSGTNLNVVPIQMPSAVDCEEPAGLPLLYGGPFGAEAHWFEPTASEGYVSVSLVDKNGVTRTAEPAVLRAYADFAEGIGVPDWPPANMGYMIGRRHVRFSNLLLELDAPFAIGPDATVTKCYIQSIGTVLGYKTDKSGSTPYEIRPETAKFFFYVSSQTGGVTKVSSFCFTNPGSHDVLIHQGPPFSFFSLDLELTSGDFPPEYDLQNALVKIELKKLPAAVSGFTTHQPYVQLTDKQVPEEFDLVPDVAMDYDNNLSDYLWFENYEMNNETFLGSGNPLHVTLAPGMHSVTLVAYDSYGASGIDTMTLTVLPSNNHCEDAWLVGPGLTIGSNIGASTQEVASCRTSHGDVWFLYRVRQDSYVTIDTCDTQGTLSDTVLSVYDGCYGTELACNDDACGAAGLRSKVKLWVPGGRDGVLIRVASFGVSGAQGTFPLRIYPVPAPASDMDHDGDVDMEDFLNFQACFNGPNRAAKQTGCGWADLDYDNDVDLADFLAFQKCFNGPNRAPKCP